MGQRIRRGSIGVWNYICPRLGGIGYASCLVSAPRGPFRPPPRGAQATKRGGWPGNKPQGALHRGLRGQQELFQFHLQVWGWVGISPSPDPSSPAPLGLCPAGDKWGTVSLPCDFDTVSSFLPPGLFFRRSLLQCHHWLEHLLLLQVLPVPSSLERVPHREKQLGGR